MPPTPHVLDTETLALLGAALERLDAGFGTLPPASAAIDHTVLERVLLETADRLRNNYPYFHPLYAGQMLKPPHPVARLAYALSLWINPNNHALDGGRASSAMEKEAIAELARMIGWSAHLGHLTGGGTMANLEALWVAGCAAPGATVLASAQAHYTHARISAVLGLPSDRMDLATLEPLLERGGVGTVVATLGTTAVGSVDPLPGILALRDRFGFRIHADAAYGGYFTLVDELDPPARAAFDRIGDVDSVVIDPHKHGLQPYGCGCVIFRDPDVGRYYRHDSPYTYFSSGDLHLGEISLECSRPGAAAVALWATQRLLPPVRGGAFAAGLAAGRHAALALHTRLAADPRVVVGLRPELDIVVWALRAETVSRASGYARRVFEEAARRDLHLALAELPVAFFEFERAGVQVDRPTVTALRSVLMKPEHLDWLDRIGERLDASQSAVLDPADRRS
jgi:tyrosine decarboxylase / aspartate 1-decarboxylase